MSRRKKNHQHINADSGQIEWYTPAQYIEAARATMDGIDLDPASSVKAQETVRATDYYTIREDALSLPWFGRVWLNWPYGRVNNEKWTRYLIEQYELGNVLQACALGFASTDTSWFQQFDCYWKCLLRDRVDFIDGNTMQPIRGNPKGSCIFYLGHNAEAFIAAYDALGAIYAPAVNAKPSFYVQPTMFEVLST